MPSEKSSRDTRHLEEQISSQSTQLLMQAFRHEGPLPDPDTLERYKNAGPSFPERIMRMTENHNAADVNLKYKIAFSDSITPITGQIFTFLLGIAGIASCVYLSSKGYTAEGIATIIGSFSPMIINAISNLAHGKDKKSPNPPSP